ncbi:hypothetical protein [Nocardia gipuzkoensis]|uniref:hypothetical protein n=1 Tax=Nocardia gipuzkoensis TaxID=2749991 RepID=UPI00237DB125|nr:hypothetical protein [Nocardia gipuzkoensis]MDE1672684.1 hypothetical protein [Nocardia gipuzkoensis]
MTNPNQPNPVPAVDPHTEPQLDYQGGETVTAWWDVDGWHKQARLTVWRCYDRKIHFAELSPCTGLGSSRITSYPSWLEIARSAEWLPLTEVKKFYDLALAEVRSRFDAGDRANSGVFRPRIWALGRPALIQ